MKRLAWPSITKRLKGRRIVDLCYDVEDGYLRLKLDDGSVLVVAASWEGVHVLVGRFEKRTSRGYLPRPSQLLSLTPKEA